MLKSCPDPVDVQDLQFKLHCRLKCFDNNELSFFQTPHSLISCASRYGLLFVGSNTNILQAIYTKSLENYSPKDKDVRNYLRRQLTLPSPPKHICVNCDCTLLAVVIDQDNCPWAHFYSVLSFYKQNLTVINKVRLSASPNVYVREINWNPSLPPVFTACKSDGSLGVYELKEQSVAINELPSDSGSTTFCWSPKGKQIAVGSKDGKITQYKPDLKAVKVINKPPIEGPYSLISLQWVSNYQFIGVYQSLGPEGTSNVIVVDAPKTGECTYTNYDDVCYSGASRPAQFYMVLQAPWNLLMIASANSTELGTLGNMGDLWTQWIVADSARAELPLSPDHQETFPVGMSFDTSATRPLPWGESSIPPCPMVLLLSHQGVLCLFNVVNLRPGVPSVCCPPDSVSDLSGLSLFVNCGSVPPQPNLSVTSSAPKVQQPSFAPKTTSTNLEPSSNAPLSQGQKQGAALFGGPKEGVPMFGGSQTGPSFFGGAQNLTIPSFGGSQTTGNSPSIGEQNKQGAPLFGGQSLGDLKPIFGAQQSTGGQRQTGSLFGGQVSLTPVKPQQQVPQKADVAPSANAPVSGASENKYSAIFSALNAPPAQTNVMPVKVLPIEVTGVNKSTQQQVVKEAPVDGKASVGAEPAEITQVVDPRAEAEKEALLKQMIRDECVYLEAELKALLYQGRSIKINLGTDEEKTDLVNKIDSLTEFLKEIIVINEGQSAEIHYLKQSLVQSWAWYEEARSRYNSSKDEAITTLLKSQPLDSAAEKRLKDIHQMKYYIESQLSQAGKALDEQWDNFQDYAKKTHRFQTPTMEAIFQTMVRQNAILQKQSYVLKDISLRIRKNSRSTNGGLLVHLNRNKNLADDFKDMSLNAQDVCERQYEKILNRTKSLTSNKTDKLRQFLRNRQVVNVTAVKTVRPNSLTTTPNKTRHMISILGAQLSPVQKPAAVKNLDFLQSTPLREFRPETKHSRTVLTQENPSDASSKGVGGITAVSSGFTPLQSSDTGKSAAVLGNIQGSAFVSTTQAKNYPNTSAVEVKPSVSTFTTSATGVSFSFSTSKPPQTIPSFTKSSFNFSNAPASGKSSFNFGAALVSKPAGGGFQQQAPTTVLSPSGTGNVASSTFSFGSASAGAPKSANFGSVSSSSAVTSASSLFGATPRAAVVSSQAEDQPSAKVIHTSSSTGGSTFFGNLTQTVASGAAQPTSKTGTSATSIAATTGSSLFSFDSKSTVKTSAPQSTTALPLFKVTTGAITTTTTASTITAKTGTTVESPKVTVTSSIFSTTSAPTSKPSMFGSSGTSIFGSTTTQPGTSIFAATSTTTQQAPLFGSTTSVFGNNSISKPQTTISFATPIPINKPATTSSTTTQPLISTTTTPISSIITTPVAKPSDTTAVSTANTTTITVTFTTTASESTVSSSPVSDSNIVSSSSTPSSPFSSSTAAPVSKPSVFGGSTAEPTVGTTQQTSIFGTNGSVSKPSIFGNVGSTAPIATQPPAYGSTSSTATSIFGAAAVSTADSTSQKSIFGARTTPAVPFGASQSIFGSTSTAVSQASIFGGAAASTQASSIFANAAATAPASPAPAFGAAAFAAQTTVSAAAPFAAQATVAPFAAATTAVSGGAAPFAAQTTASPFGEQASRSIFAQSAAFGSGASVFGGGTAAVTTATGSIFGKPAAFGSQAVFGSTAAATPSVFGGTTTSSSTFGTGFGTVSSTTSVFGAPVTSQPSSFSFTSAANNAPTTGGGGSAFGLGSLSVNSGTSGGSLFGSGGATAFGQTPAQNPFGKTEQPKSPFGGGSASIFGSPATFGGSAPGTGTFTSSSFGSASAFGQQQKPAFGQSAFGSSTFGSPQPGAFSAAAGAPVGQTGFGSPSSFQKPAGFGSPPTFGGSPAFGASPSFGGAPAFGAAPAFGSPDKVFGASSPTGITGGFGAAAATPSTGFESLATQNTIGFGNLAQQGAPPNSAPFSGASSFSSWR